MPTSISQVVIINSLILYNQKETELTDLFTGIFQHTTVQGDKSTQTGLLRGRRVIVVDRNWFEHAYIVTTLLNPLRYPSDEIASLYLKRWGVELFFRDIKVGSHDPCAAHLDDRQGCLEWHVARKHNVYVFSLVIFWVQEIIQRYMKYGDVSQGSMKRWVRNLMSC